MDEGEIVSGAGDTAGPAVERTVNRRLSVIGRFAWPIVSGLFGLLLGAVVTTWNISGEVRPLLALPARVMQLEEEARAGEREWQALLNRFDELGRQAADVPR